MSETASSSDANQTLIFVDLLGFSALTLQYPNRAIHSGPDADGISTVETAPTQYVINTFARLVDRAIYLWRDMPVTAMLFSDCAFLNVGPAAQAVVFATDLFRQCVTQRVPVRMGIGHGTFERFVFSTESWERRHISTARFIGTAVIHSHAAERYELEDYSGKGMRIFLHPSMDMLRGEIEDAGVKILPLKDPTGHAQWELDFLQSGKGGELFEAVATMDDPAAPSNVRRHYIETYAAINRMLTLSGHPEISTDEFKDAYRPYR
jgi:hypothetical protein